MGFRTVRRILILIPVCLAASPFRYNPRVRFLLCCFLAAVAAAGTLQASSLDDRHAAIDRALNFLYKTAQDDANFSRYGADLLWCFYTIAHTASDPRLSESAGLMGRELAQRWRKSHRHVPANANAAGIFQLVTGAYSADRLGFPNRRYKAELRQVAAKFNAQDYLGFDPAHEPPRLDNPDRYDQWYGALIVTFFGDAYGIPLGAHYGDVLQWLPRLRPYEGHDADTEFDIFYAITHVIYTLDRYHERRVSSSLLPDELAFLRHKLKQAIEDENPEMVSEALDCLKATGFETDPQVADGLQFLVSTQRPDGSWAGDPDDPYTEYHSAWAGIDGLRDYRFQGQVKTLPVH
jgi:Prenyltransferase and squalene oxidase repeat